MLLRVSTSVYSVDVVVVDNEERKRAATRDIPLYLVCAALSPRVARAAARHVHSAAFSLRDNFLSSERVGCQVCFFCLNLLDSDIT